MSSYLRQNVIGWAPKLPISDEQFEAIVDAHSILNSAFAIEESYDLLIGNYVEVEQELLAATAMSAVRDLHTHHDFFELRSTINRRFVNLLTATRLYLDQTPQRLSNCATTPEVAISEFKKRTHDHYDATFSYRFLEALRNHVQHCGLAVHRFSLNNKLIDEGEEQALELSIQPFAEKRYLIADGRFKPKILDEMPEQVVLTHVIREYLQCIGDLHKLVRSHVTERANEARQIIGWHLSEYAKESNGATIGLTAFRVDSRGRKESVPLLLDWDDVRIELVARNSGMVALGRHIVTGRAR